MPKRVLDGEGLWKSDKLARVQPAWAKAELANLIPLALANGVFEASARRIWSQAYSYNRPEIGVEKVEEILSAFEKAGLLFRWHDAGTAKFWGFWVGIDKPGRLPPPSRLRKRHETVGPSPPPHELRKYVESPNGSQWLANGCPGFGFGLGSGNGSGTVTHETERDSHSIQELIDPQSEKNRKSTGKKHDLRRHLENGIYRNRLFAIYDDCCIAQRRTGEENFATLVREVTKQCTSLLFSERGSVELRGQSEEQVLEKAWKRIQQALPVLEHLQDYDTRKRQTGGRIINCVVDAALEMMPEADSQLAMATSAG